MTRWPGSRRRPRRRPARGRRRARSRRPARAASPGRYTAATSCLPSPKWEARTPAAHAWVGNGTGTRLGEVAMKQPMVGWIFFAAVIMIITGVLDLVEGLIAVFRDTYYALAPDQIIVFDTTAWGW